MSLYTLPLQIASLKTLVKTWRIENQNVKYTLMGLAALGALAGCATPVEDLKPTSFKGEMLNKEAEGRMVTILHLMPAKAKVSNAENHRTAETVGTISGAAVCGVAAGVAAGIFAGAGAGAGAGVGGAILCGYLGHYIGAIIEPPELHPDSLIIAYQDPNNPQIQQTIEIARACEFKPGSGYAVVIKNPKTKKLETRIQPNNFEACLSRKKIMEQDREMLKTAKKTVHQKHQEGSHTTAAEDAYKKGITTPSRIEEDGTIILNGTYLGKFHFPESEMWEQLKAYGKESIDFSGSAPNPADAPPEGNILTLDSRRTAELRPDGAVYDVTEKKNQRLIGNIPQEQAKDFLKCVENPKNCKNGKF